MKTNARALARASCMTAHGEAFNEEVFASAFEKLKRHVKKKYGSLDWEEEYAESGTDSVLFFYEESANGCQQTWNGAKAAKAVGSVATKPAVSEAALDQARADKEQRRAVMAAIDKEENERIAGRVAALEAMLRARS